ncbi:glycosyltransferase family 9 protein [Cruoricaptor ignavus]|uniref:Glycosyltransferase family 9 protein n=2 Tax=Cruoricaptor ignavus TaxID=1118202 RepID=A0A7M1T4Q3_9FLAO|nr:glycosyltransferase family 9 protein [Cruoricaptor ignavus]
MAAIVCREFLQQNPDVQVMMVTRENFRELFLGIPNLVFKGVNLDDYRGYFGLRRLALSLIKEFQPDGIADLHDVIRTKVFRRIFELRGYRVAIIDKGKEGKEALTDVQNLDKFQLKPTVERYADVFRDLGFPVKLSHELCPTTEEKQNIGFAPFAQHKGKMLSPAKSFELARLLAKEEKVYFFGGGESETETLRHWQAAIPNTECVAGRLSLTEELQLIARLRLMVSMDSANMHLASLVGTRCISVWGGTHRYAGFLGYGQSVADVAEVKDLSCRPCSVFGDKECYRGDYACLEELSIQQILEKIKR